MHKNYNKNNNIFIFFLALKVVYQQCMFIVNELNAFVMKNKQ